MSRVALVYYLVLALFGVVLVVVSVSLLCSLPGAGGGTACALAP